jgi:hypothetical protein
MKLVPCSYVGCRYRRDNWEQKPDEQPRAHQQVEVPDNHEGPAYCSTVCQVCDNLS